MTVFHKQFSFIAGDDFFINARLTNEDNKPYDLDALDEIRWLLHDNKSQIVPHEFLIRHIDAADGRLNVWIPHEVTTFFPGGVYYDWLRIVCGGIVSTLLTGPINITADPWRAPVAEIAMASAFSPLTATVERLAASHSVADLVVRLNRRERIERRPVIDRDEAADVLPFMRRRDEARR